MNEPLGNPGRSAHRAALRSSDILYSARCTLAEFFGISMPENVIFTQNTTSALNMAILGSAAAVGRKFTVITSVLEHNSVLRPLYFLESIGRIELKFIKPDLSCPAVAADLISSEITRETAMVVLTARSNTCGFSFPLREIGALLQKLGILFIVDGAQAAGSADIMVERDYIDILCLPGHKGILGITGSGAMIVNPACKLLPEAIFSGGSGSASSEHFMPEYMPDRFEAGTPPLLGAATMASGISYISERGRAEIENTENALGRRLREGLSVIKGVSLYAPSPSGLALFNLRSMNSEELAARLDESGICARGGFHCAPKAHELFKTASHGAVRLSPGAFSTCADIDRALSVINSL